MILLTLALLTLAFRHTACYNLQTLVGRLEREEWIRTYIAVQSSELWRACSYHVTSSRVLSVTILEPKSQDFKFYFTHFVTEVNRRLDIPITLTVGHNKLQKRFTASSKHSHLLIAPNSSCLNLYLEGSKDEYPQNIWRPQDNFLFLIFTSDTDTNDTYRGIFDRLWNERGIMNVLIVIKSFEEIQVEYILAYEPFLVEGENNRPLMWVVQPDKLHELPKVFSDRTINLHGYVLNVSMFNDRPTSVLRYDNLTDRWTSQGRDGQVLDIISTYMNFTPLIIPPSDRQKIGYKISNGTFTGVIADLINRRTYIVVNEVFMKHYGTQDVEVITPVLLHQEIVIIVPKSSQIHIWIVVYKALRRIHYHYLLLSFMSCVLMSYVIRRFGRKRDRATGEASLFANMLAVFLNMPLRFLTRTKSCSQRLLFASCLISSLFMMCNFEGLLLDIVRNPHFDINTATLQELEEVGLSIFTENHVLMDTFNGTESMETLGGKLAYEWNAMSVVTLMKRHKNVSLLCRKERAAWWLWRHGDGKLHIIDEAARAYFMSYLVPKGSPYLPRLRVLFGRIIQSGLVDKLNEDAKYEMELSTDELPDDDDDLGTVQSSLTLADLAMVFVILLLGLLVCTLVFLVELCISRHSPV